MTSVNPTKSDDDNSTSHSANNTPSLFQGPTQSADPLAAHVHEKSTFATVTGEEGEEVWAELKGAKLFVKRGAREFSGGVLGRVRVLSKHDSESETASDRRICESKSQFSDHRERLVERTHLAVFRREPVWKVSMNVRLGAEVRCTLDEEQGVLRIVLKEAVESDADAKEMTEQEVVVYALKVSSSAYLRAGLAAHEYPSRCM